MTRGEIKNLAARLLREALGTAPADDPFTLDDLLEIAANELAKRTFCWYEAFESDLVAGRAPYCDSNIFKLKAVRVLDAAGKEQPLIPTDPTGLDRHFGAATWRNAPAADPPQYAAFEGLRQVRLYPVPSVNRANGLILEGYATPAGLWPGDADECPLPEWSQDAIAWRLCQLRSMQFVGEIPGADVKAAFWGGEWKRARQDVEAKAAQYHPKPGLRPWPGRRVTVVI